MKKILILLLCLLFLPIVTGVAGAPGADPPPLLNVRGLSAPIEAGSRCEVRMSINNISQQEIALRYGAKHDFEVRLLVKDQRGYSTVLPIVRQFRSLGTRFNILVPGQMVYDYIPLCDMFDLSQPGTYVFQDIRTYWVGDATHNVTSERVEFRVVSPEEYRPEFAAINAPDPVSITISVRGVPVPVGEPVVLHVALKNESGAPLTILHVSGYNHAEADYAISIMDSKGHPVRRLPARKDSEAPVKRVPYDLPRGPTVGEDCDLAEYWDLYLPGTYTVQASLPIPPNAKEPIQSNIFPFTITAP